ncbi:MAG: protein translocase subunit SecF [Chloroflexi bacterium]|jgi:preprotein translocase subunit SecF|nr:MAG: protein translocase subunit SecF [Chloroflexota bacterium]
MKIIEKRYWYFLLSLLVMLPGLTGLAVWGLPLAIDFTGGSKLELRLPAASALTVEAVQALLAENGLENAIAQLAENNTVIVRSKAMEDATKGKLVAALEARFGGKSELLAFESVGPVVGAEVTWRAAQAVGVAALGILVYITYAFRGIDHAARYGVCAIIAMLHDVAMVVGITALLGHWLGWEVDALFLTALLTVIGFSVHDTIVVFDRIRENLLLHRRASYEAVVNHSMVQTLDRSINTQLTALLALLALALFGGSTTFRFVVTLMIGILSGTFSSIFNAAPILVVWENREWRTWFRRRSPAAG